MIKTCSKLLIVLTLAVSLAACGGGNNEANSGGNANIVEPDTATPEPATGENQAEENPDADAEGETQDPAEPAEETPVSEPPAATMDVEIEVEGTKEFRTGTLSESDNGYYMYTIPPFVFTPEEPGRDQVYMEAYSDYFMRVEALPEDVDLTEIRANAEVELKAVSEAFEERTGEQIYDTYLRNAEFYLQAIGDELVKKIIVMDIDGKLFKFTMFMPVGGEASEGAESGFNAMIKTIKPVAASK